jgi:hypothetical protein
LGFCPFPEPLRRREKRKGKSWGGGGEAGDRRRAAAGALLRRLDEVARSRTGKEASVTEEEPDRSGTPP